MEFLVAMVRHLPLHLHMVLQPMVMAMDTKTEMEEEMVMENHLVVTYRHRQVMELR